MKPDLDVSLWKAASVIDAGAVNPDGIKMLLAYCLSKFLVMLLKLFLFYTIEVLIILYYLKNYLQKLYKAFKLGFS